LICITAALLAVALIVLAVFGIAGAIKNRGAEEEETEETGDQIPKDYVTTEFSKDQSANGPLLMLDASHPYTGTATTVQPAGNLRVKTEDGSDIYKGAYGDINITQETLDAFNAMMLAFHNEQKSNSEYRVGSVWLPSLLSGLNEEISVATKEALKSGYLLILENQYDEADPSIYDAENKTGKGVYQWIYQNAAKYGFIQVGDSAAEGNIFRYVGVVHATYMTDKNLSFADYITKLHTTTGIGKTLKVTAEGVKYEIFYIAPGETHIKPESYDFTVSGDNMGGYIVTVNKTAKTDK